MTLRKFLVIAFVVFLLGVGVLYTGFNRVPFRHSGNHEMHKSSLSITTAVNVMAVNKEMIKGVDLYEKV